MKRVESALSFENQMYRVGIPWKSDTRALPDIYEMALRRLENTEKWLKKSPDVVKAYNKCIEQYVQKGYVTKVQRVGAVNVKVVRSTLPSTKTRQRNHQGENWL